MDLLPPETVQSSLQRTLSATFQQRVVCTSKLPLPKADTLKPYAFVVYERDELPGSTGSVLFYADSPQEITQRAHIPLATVYRMLANERIDKQQNSRLPYVIKKVYLV